MANHEVAIAKLNISILITVLQSFNDKCVERGLHLKLIISIKTKGWVRYSL